MIVTDDWCKGFLCGMGWAMFWVGIAAAIVMN